MARTIETKIRHEVLGPVFEIEEIRSHWLHRLGWLNAYSTEAILLLSTVFGITLSSIVEALDRSLFAQTASPTALSEGSAWIMPMPIALAAFFFVLLVFVLRAINTVHKMSDRHTIGRTALSKIKGFEGMIERALADDEREVVAITEYIEDKVRPAFVAASDGDCIPGHSEIAKERISARTEACLERLRNKFPGKLSQPISGRREPANV
jgi:hypothetical protein